MKLDNKEIKVELLYNDNGKTLENGVAVWVDNKFIGYRYLLSGIKDYGISPEHFKKVTQDIIEKIEEEE